MIPCHFPSEQGQAIGWSFSSERGPLAELRAFARACPSFHDTPNDANVQAFASASIDKYIVDARHHGFPARSSIIYNMRGKNECLRRQDD